MTRSPAIVFCADGHGHLRRLLPLIGGLTAAGVPTYVYTGSGSRERVERAGGRFIDLYAGRTLASADATSVPLPCRNVTFAGRYAEAIAREVAPLRPGIVVHDTFAVIGRPVAYHLGVPRVNVCAGHNAAPIPTVAALERDPRVAISAECWQAVELLRERHGMPDASPFSYVSTMSPDLNLYCEPPEFLRPEERAPFEPIAFFGPLSPAEIEIDRADGTHSAFDPATAADARLRLYVSFGTIIWRYYAAAAVGALESIADAVAERDDVVALVSLGNGIAEERVAHLVRPNVRVARHVDQWRVLGEASLFLTHHGLNSTHEAIFRRVPMLSYPFFGDQPALARRSQELGLALPLVDGPPDAPPRGPVSPADVHAAVARAAAERRAILERLEEARRWELAVIEARGAVIERILGLW